MPRGAGAGAAIVPNTAPTVRILDRLTVTVPSKTGFQQTADFADPFEHSTDEEDSNARCCFFAGNRVFRRVGAVDDADGAFETR